ncbi:NACHT domain-containing protein [Pseudomonas sp. CCOS 191]|uniref:NACHT domain-containing protein n=1 Tax=Pseudomonas sp. CCOS 191 TaxID=1649877 RepID=UPI000624CC6A|nr:NACHT domain-containing protein [Pseudomonas sp. CCOS 191]CRI55387.1 NTPase [Pseudomonas sp. CCOS 191]
MALTSAALTTLVARSLTPAINDLYNAAKGAIKESLEKIHIAQGGKKFARSLLKVEKVKTIWSPDKEMSVMDFYYPSSIKVNEDRLAIKKIKDLPLGNLIIEGIVGRGKSIFLRYLAATMLRDEDFHDIPIFLELRTISPKRTIVQAVERYMNSIGLDMSEGVFEYIASSGKLCLLLDGFDEISDESVNDVVEEIEFLQIRYPDLRLIISSRPGNEIQKLPGFEVVELLSLTEDDYDPFMKKLNIPSAKRVELISAIEESPSNIEGIISTPLMMTLVILVYESEREIPRTLPEFFEKLFHVVFTRHDRLKIGFNRKHFSGLSERKLQKVFEAFCFMVIELGHGRTLDAEAFDSTFEAAIQYVEDCKCEVDGFKKDIVKVACLMMEEGIGGFAFLHKSIMEYYAAAFIKHSPEDIGALFYEEAAKQDPRKWKPILTFLESIDKYRFSKYFMLVDGMQLQHRITGILERRDDNELLNFIGEFYPEVAINFLPDGRPVSFGPMGPLLNYWHDWLDSNLGVFIFDLVDSKEDIEVAARAINGGFPGVIVHEKKGRMGIKLCGLIELYGPDKMWTQLEFAETQIHELVKAAQGVVDANKLKRSIFAKKPKKDEVSA